MTNGEKILNGFSNATIRRCKNEDFTYIEVEQNDKWIADFNIEWWEAKCKEPITKNDLGVKNDLVSSIVEKISEKVTETREEFIFETIRPYCENVVQMKISKRDLEQALLKYYGKNNLGVDCIDRADAIKAMQEKAKKLTNEDTINGLCGAVAILFDLPSVTPQESRIITCKECKYYRNKGNKYSYCTKRLNVDSITDRYREPNFYCADAVLREVEE